MQIKEAPSVGLARALESTALEVVVLADCAGVAPGAPQGFSPKVHVHRHDVSGLAGSRWIEIPLVGGDGKVSGVLRLVVSRAEGIPARRPEGVGGFEDLAQFAVHDINNLFTAIDSGLRLLECHDDAVGREAIVGKMQEAIVRGGLLTRQLLNTAGVRLDPIEAVVEGERLAALATALDRALGPDIAIRTEIAPNLWDFYANTEEMYFVLLNLCRNSADAMPNGGAITVAARNVESFGGALGKAVEIVVADDGEGMSEDVLAQALDPYFTTRAPGIGTGLRLPQVRRFVEGRGGTVGIESKRGGGTVVRLCLPCTRGATHLRSGGAGEVVYVATPDGGVFHVVKSPTTASET